MPSIREWTVINLSLGLLALLLIAPLAGITLPNLGKVFYLLDGNEPLMVIEWQGQFSSCKDINRCCLEALQQAECVLEVKNTSLGDADWRCSSGNSVEYRMNTKAYAYCSLQPYWSR